MSRLVVLALVAVTLGGSACVGQKQPLPAYKQEFSISARQFELQPSEIRVKAGQQVKITVTSADVDHGIAIPELNLAARKTEPRKAVLEFTPQKPGTYQLRCNVPCGEGHDRMVSTLVVE